MADSALTKEQKKLKLLQKKQEAKREERLKDLENAQDSDPFSWLGFGLMAYRHTIWTLFALFFILSILVYPIVMSN